MKEMFTVHFSNNEETDYDNILQGSLRIRNSLFDVGYEDIIHDETVDHCHDDSEDYVDIIEEADNINSTVYFSNSEETDYDNILQGYSRIRNSLFDVEYEDIIHDETVDHCHNDSEDYEDTIEEVDNINGDLDCKKKKIVKIRQECLEKRRGNSDTTNIVERGEDVSVRKDQISLGTYDMHRLEKIMLERICIRRIHERLYYFDGRIFRPLDKKKFLRLMRDQLPEEVMRGISSYSKLEEVYKFLETNDKINMEISEETAAVTKRLIVFSNGIYDVERERLQSFSIEYPVFFDIDACYLPDERLCKTPVFDKFLDDVSGGDNQIKKQIMEMIGYLLLQGAEGKCFFVLGTKRNSGKSLLGDFISSLFDEEAVANIPLTSIGERFALGSIWKKAINISMDLPTKTLTEDDVSQIKLITGEKRINTEEKYEPAGTTFIYCKNVFATNGAISLKVYDDAFWDRLVFVPFMNSVEKNDQDKELLNKLLRERDGIVTKAAKAAKELIQNNFRFPEPEVAQRIVESWKMKTENSVELFVKNRCETHCEGGEFQDDIYEEYKKYCLHNKLQVMTNVALIRFLKKIPGVTGCKKRKSAGDNPTSYIMGIGLKDRLDKKLE